MERLLLFGIPGLLLAAVIVITRSDIIRRIYGWSKGVPMPLSKDFEYILLEAPFGFALHKLWTCDICQSVHVAWLSGIALFFALELPLLAWWSFFAFVILSAQMFLVSYSILSSGGSGEHGYVKEGEREAVSAAGRKSAPLPVPKKGYVDRLRTTREGRKVIVEGMDDYARLAVELMGGLKDCGSDSGFPGCAALKERLHRELEEAEAAKCPKCEQNDIKRRFYDAAIAMMGG